jgi:hypothetical protein
MTKRLLAISAAVLMLPGCFNPFAPDKAKTGTVRYEVTGSARHVMVTYSSSSGGKSQTGSDLPFIYSWTAEEGNSLYVSALIDQADDNGSITVTIFKDDTSIESAVAAGGLSTATASATF